MATAAETVTDDDAVADTTDTASAEPENVDSTDDVVEALAALEPPPDRREVVFIDAAVSDYQSLIAGMGDGVEVVILSTDRDGVIQIAEYLDGRADIDSIQIFSHGDVGEVRLGNAVLDASNLDAYTDALARIGASLTESGDILLYGCRVGADGAGQAFIDSIAALTGADIAASDDLTGSSALGGDWVLEASTGTIEAANAVGAEALDSYSYVLADPRAGFGTALDFDGTNDFVDIVDITGAQLSGAVTIEAWVNFDAFSSFARIVDLSETGEADDNVALYIAGTTGRLSMNIYNGAVLNAIKALVALPTNEWVHVAGVTDGTTGTLYYNGVAQPLLQVNVNGDGGTNPKDTSAALIGATAVTRAANFIGKSSDAGTTFMNGTIDEVRVWNDARTTAEILANLYTPLKGNEADLVAYWNFDEGSGTTSTDRSTNTLTGTLTDFATPNASYVTAAINVQAAATDTTTVITMDGFDTDNDGATQTDTVTPKIATLPTKGTLFQTTDGTTSNGTAIAAGDSVTNTDGKVIYVLSGSGQSGSDSYTYQVSDGANDSANTETVTIPLQLEVATRSVDASSGSTSVTGAGTAIVIDSAITITNMTRTIDQATVTISGGLGGGEILGFTDQNGITGSFSGDVLTLSGTTTVANYQTAFRTVTYSTSAAGTATPTITFAIQPTADQTIGGNNHFYATVTTEVTATQAQTDAANQSLFGLIGYLVSILSADEKRVHL